MAHDSRHHLAHRGGGGIRLEHNALERYARLADHAKKSSRRVRRTVASGDLDKAGRDRHDRIPVILETETSVLRAAALTTISRHRGGRCGEKTIEQRD